MWFAPVEEYSNTPFPNLKWVDHCQHVKWVTINEKVAEIKKYTEDFALGKHVQSFEM